MIPECKQFRVKTKIPHIARSLKWLTTNSHFPLGVGHKLGTVAVYNLMTCCYATYMSVPDCVQ